MFKLLSKDNNEYTIEWKITNICRVTLFPLFVLDDLLFHLKIFSLLLFFLFIRKTNKNNIIKIKTIRLATWKIKQKEKRQKKSNERSKEGSEFRRKKKKKIASTYLRNI